MVNIYLNLIKASLVIELKNLFLTLILAFEEVLILANNDINKTGFNIKVNKRIILLKPLIKHW